MWDYRKRQRFNAKDATYTRRPQREALHACSAREPHLRDLREPSAAFALKRSSISPIPNHPPDLLSRFLRTASQLAASVRATGWWSEAVVAVSTATATTRGARSSVTKMKSRQCAPPGHCSLSAMPQVGSCGVP